VKGTFDDVSGTINFDEKNVGKSSVDVKIMTTSVDTRTAKRDEHLRSADFFDVTKYPEMTFVSKKIIGSGKKFKVEGDLSMHGVTKPVTLAVEYLGASKDPWGNMRAGFSATTKINRKDYGLTWNKALETGGVLIGDDVEVNIDIEAVKKTDEKPADKAASN
jgi:polyisoprenoid-binding protein YceI